MSYILNSFLDLLPREILLEICSHCDYGTLLNLRLVDKKRSEIINYRKDIKPKLESYVNYIYDKLKIKGNMISFRGKYITKNIEKYKGNLHCGLNDYIYNNIINLPKGPGTDYPCDMSIYNYSFIMEEYKCYWGTTDDHYEGFEMKTLVYYYKPINNNKPFDFDPEYCSNKIIKEHNYFNIKTMLRGLLTIDNVKLEFNFE